LSTPIDGATRLSGSVQSDESRCALQNQGARRVLTRPNITRARIGTADRPTETQVDIAPYLIGDLYACCDR
jgi:hypothetical protein